MGEGPGEDVPGPGLHSLWGGASSRDYVEGLLGGCLLLAFFFLRTKRIGILKQIQHKET